MERSNPLLIGITGGIGSGKSTVCKIFLALGVPVYDADTRAKWLMNHSQALMKSIQKLLGVAAYKNGQIDREYVAGKTFHQPEVLKGLNALVHPAVGRDFERWASAQRSKYVIKEAALLYESGSHLSLNKIIVVTAPEKLRIKRVLSRDPYRNENDIRAIMANQWPEAKKVEMADFVIINDDTRLVIPQVLEINRIIVEGDY